MNVARAGLLAALLVAVLTTSACGVFRRSAKAHPLPAPIAVPASTQATQVSLPTAPNLPPEPPAIDEAPTMPPEPVPPPPRRRVAVPRPRPALEQPVAPDPSPASLTPGFSPQLGQMLSPEQQRAFHAEIDRHIADAQRALADLNGRRLTSEQQTYLARIRAFVQQALEARSSDLLRARNLAERASLLAADLSRNLQ